MEISLDIIDKQSDHWLNHLLKLNNENLDNDRLVNMYVAVKLINDAGKLDSTDSLYFNNHMFENLFKMDRQRLSQYISDIISSINEGKYVNTNVENNLTEMSRVDIVKNIIDNVSIQENERMSLNIIYLSDNQIKLYKEAVYNILTEQENIID